MLEDTVSSIDPSRDPCCKKSWFVVLPSPTWPNTLVKSPSLPALSLEMSVILLSIHTYIVKFSYILISSAIRDRGTATSVDHICVPSGRIARLAQRACFRADHRESISASVPADTKDVHLYFRAISFAVDMLSMTVFSVPGNLLLRISCTSLWHHLMLETHPKFGLLHRQSN